MVLKAAKEIWDLKENPVLLDSRGYQEHRGCLDLKDQLDNQVKKVLRVVLGCQVYLDLMDLLVIPEKKDLLEKKELWVNLVHRGQLATQDLVVLRGLMESED